MIRERKMFSRARHGGQHFSIVVLGDEGAIEFHFVTMDDRKYDHAGTFPLSSMGVEMHKRVSESEANRGHCDLAGGPCYHDGTSLWASETVMPAFMSGGSEAVYPYLERCYRDRFLREAENE